MGNRKLPFGYQDAHGRDRLERAGSVRVVSHLPTIYARRVAEGNRRADENSAPLGDEGKSWNKNMTALNLGKHQATGADSYPRLVDIKII